jgi:nitrogen fixation NifU-like protein
VGTGMVGAPACGDVMKLQIKVNPQTGVIEDARFKTYGCGSAIASSSLVTEWVKGKTLDEAAALKNSQIAEELALPPVKIHCSILAEDAIKAAVDDYKKKHAALRLQQTWHHPDRSRGTACDPLPAKRGKGWVCAWASRPRAARAWPTSLSTWTKSQPEDVVFRRARRQGADRPQEPGLHRRHRARLCARRPERRFQVQQPERARPLRLRRELPGLMILLADEPPAQRVQAVFR